MNTNATNCSVSKQPKLILARHLYSASVRKMNPGKQQNSFSTALAHEIRNPLTNINLALEMLSSTMPDSDQQLFIDIIRRGSIRINGLITELLTAGVTAEIPSGDHFINQLLDEVLVQAEDRLRLKNITVKREYTASDCRIWMYKQQVVIALTNIIVNAIDAMPANTGTLKLITQSINGLCIISIEDNGMGISKKNLENIFKPFFTAKSGGMGIGLSTSLEMLRANHIRVDVHSEVGHGTRFLLSFERADSCGVS